MKAAKTVWGRHSCRPLEFGITQRFCFLRRKALMECGGSSRRPPTGRRRSRRHSREAAASGSSSLRHGQWGRL